MKSVNELNDLVHDSEEEGLWTSSIRKTVVHIRQHSRHSTRRQLFLHSFVCAKGYARTEQTLPLWPSNSKVSSETTDLYDWIDGLMIAYIALLSTLLSRLTALSCGST